MTRPMIFMRTARSGCSALALTMAISAPALAQTVPPQQTAPAGTQLPLPDEKAPTTDAIAVPQTSTDNPAASVADTDAAEVRPAVDADIVVTGSRLSNGMSTATPVTISSAVDLQKTAPSNIAEGLNRLPAFSATTTSRSPVSTGTTGTIGQNLLNLRGLGLSRNLVLLDGRRIVTSNQEFAVDINTLPQNLVQRVDVVTGGASAAYGSDAVAGVVNFVLDKQFSGLKVEFNGGVSTYGDAGSWRASVAFGQSLLNDRLHILAGTEYYRLEGIAINDKNDRDWFNAAYGLLPNTTGTGPTNLVVPNVRSSIGTNGGLITSSSLSGLMFLPGGATAQFNRGFTSGPVFQSGGDGSIPRFGFTPGEERSVSFARATFDLTPDISVFGEGGYSFNETFFSNSYNQMVGAGFAFTIFNNNAFLPASVRSAMTAGNVTSFRLGRFLTDFGPYAYTDRTDTSRFAAGLSGRNLFGLAGWKWDVAATSGTTKQYFGAGPYPNLRRIYAAADAVALPGTGQIVCRSQFYTAAGVFVPGGTGLDAGCVPLNLFGEGSPSPEAINWVSGYSEKWLKIRQQTVSASVAGDFGDRFKLGGGPISFAIGGEYRKDSADQDSDPLAKSRIDLTGVRGAPATLVNRLGYWRNGNPQPFAGSQRVTEGFAELGVPILADRRWAKTLSLNLAGRYTHYSLAGDVQTWKVGLEYAPSDDIRLRGTVSRDIRAANLFELFNSAVQNTNNVLFPSSTQGTTTPSLIITSGNPTLRPEKALTQTYGIVLTPSAVPGLSASFDYYKIDIEGAITTLTAQNLIDFCAAGQTEYCALVNLSGGIVNVALRPLNLNNLVVSGVDAEVNYRTELFGNPLGLRLFANYAIDNYTQAPNAAPLQVRDSAVAPIWRGQAQISYSVANWSLFVNQQYIAPVKMDPNQREGVYTNDNSVPAIFYTDVTLTKKFDLGGKQPELFLSVQNLFNRSPPVNVIPPTGTTNPTNNVYDRVGRYITAGFRVTL